MFRLLATSDLILLAKFSYWVSDYTAGNNTTIRSQQYCYQARGNSLPVHVVVVNCLPFFLMNTLQSLKHDLSHDLNFFNRWHFFLLKMLLKLTKWDVHHYWHKKSTMTIVPTSQKNTPLFMLKKSNSVETEGDYKPENTFQPFSSFIVTIFVSTLQSKM